MKWEPYQYIPGYDDWWLLREFFRLGWSNIRGTISYPAMLGEMLACCCIHAEVLENNRRWERQIIRVANPFPCKLRDWDVQE